MSLSERIAARLCRHEGCKRAPAYEGQSYCREHALPWRPGWLVNLKAKELVR